MATGECEFTHRAERGFVQLRFEPDGSHLVTCRLAAVVSTTAAVLASCQASMV